jgi:large subunit ribosomal protein L10
MPKTKTQKQELVVEFTDKLTKAKSVVFADYKGLTMAQLSGLRNELRDQGAEFSVTKNNLIKIALKDSKANTPDEVFEGPIATLFSYEDEISPIKALVKLLKDSGLGKVKGGIYEEEFMDQYKVIKLASLPGKDELRAKVVGSLGAPLYGIVGVLQANLRNLVYVLDQIKNQKT